MTKTDEDILKAIERLEERAAKRDERLEMQENSIRKELLADLEELSTELDEDFEVEAFENASLLNLKQLKRAYSKAAQAVRRQSGPQARLVDRTGSTLTSNDIRETKRRLVDMVALSMNLPTEETVPEEKKQDFIQASNQVEMEMYNKGWR